MLWEADSAPTQPDQPVDAWLEVSLVVDGELAEAVAEVLARFAPGGVVVEFTRIDPDAQPEGAPVGPMRVYAYLPVDAALEEKRQRLEQSLWYLGRIRPLPAAEFRTVQTQNWAEAWKTNYRPIPVGARLMILPAWLDAQPGETRLAIRIDPGMAFGTGTHPTTQLCLQLLEAYVRPGQPVIDVGSGSGILSVAAVKLGASRALAVDIDRDALPAARQNAEMNAVTGEIEVGLGSVGEIRAGQFGLRRAPLVLANILAPVIARLLDDGLADLLEPGGVLILSGILDVQLKGEQGHIALLEALEKHHLEILQDVRIQDWVALAVRQA